MQDKGVYSGFILPDICQLQLPFVPNIVGDSNTSAQDWRIGSDN